MHNTPLLDVLTNTETSLKAFLQHTASIVDILLVSSECYLVSWIGFFCVSFHRFFFCLAPQLSMREKRAAGNGIREQMHQWSSFDVILLYLQWF